MRHNRKLYLAIALLMIASLLATSVVFAQSGRGLGGPRPPFQQEGGRPFLGVGIEQVDGGVLINQIVPGSAAAEAGLQIDDVITAINGVPVGTTQALTAAVLAQEPGSTVELEVLRDGEVITIEATLGTNAIVRRGGPGLGMPELRDLLPDLRGFGSELFEGFQLDLDEAVQFLIERDGLSIGYSPVDQIWTIRALPETHPLYEAGLREGDRITAVDGQTLNPMNLRQYLETLDEGAMLSLSIERGDELLTVEVPASEFDLFGFGMGLQFGRGDLPFDMLPPMSLLMPVRLGVSFIPIDETVAAERDLPVTEGALIVNVLPGSPAAEIGLQVDDIITAVDGKPVDANATLQDLIRSAEPGAVVTLDVLRGDEMLQLEVTLAQPGQLSRFEFRGPRGFRFGLPFEFEFPFEIPALPELEKTPQPNV
ncbi:MAG: PDZ domain-containing protein [Aggregatilineales bacterium]